MRLEGMYGKSAEQACAETLEKALNPVSRAFTVLGSAAMAKETRRHVSERYPGSRHWSPEKIKPLYGKTGEAAAEVDIPGAGRAYHDVEIRPKKAKFLAVPFRRGVAIDKPDAFVVRTSSGKLLLAERRPAGVGILAVLVKRVRQKKDPSLMPSDGALLEAAWNAAASQL